MKAQIRCESPEHAQQGIICSKCGGQGWVEAEVFTKEQVVNLSELIQDDLICYLDGLHDNLTTGVCKIVAARVSDLLSNEQ